MRERACRLVNRAECRARVGAGIDLAPEHGDDQVRAPGEVPIQRPDANSDVVRARFLNAFSDERRLDAVEQLIPLANDAGLPMTHLAMAFAITHPAVTSALIGPRTMTHLDDLLAGIDVTLSDDILDRIDEIVPPGTDIGTLDQAYVPPAIQLPSLRRRHAEQRAAA
jgi:aldo/keto reductase family protein